MENNKYYNLIISKIKKHQKYNGLEPILEDIAKDVYEHSTVIIGTVNDEEIISNYLDKVISTSIITIPKKLNFNSKARQIVSKQISESNINEIVQNKDSSLEISTNITEESLEEIFEITEENIAIEPKEMKISIDRSLVDKMINGNSKYTNELPQEFDDDFIADEDFNEDILIEEDVIIEEEPTQELVVEDDFTADEDLNREILIEEDVSIEEEPIQELVVDDDFTANEELNGEILIEEDVSIEEEPIQELVVEDDFTADEDLNGEILIEEDVIIEEEPTQELVVEDDFTADEDLNGEILIEEDVIIEEEPIQEIVVDDDFIVDGDLNEEILLTDSIVKDGKEEEEEVVVIFNDDISNEPANDMSFAPPNFSCFNYTPSNVEIDIEEYQQELLTLQKSYTEIDLEKLCHLKFINKMEIDDISAQLNISKKEIIEALTDIINKLKD